MTEDQFDDSLKNKIRDHRSPVPDDMWERINKKKDKDRKGFLFFFMGLSVLIAGVCLGGYLLMHQTKQKPEGSIHAVSGEDLKPGADTLASHLNKEAVRKEENSSAVAQHIPKSNKESYSSNPSSVRKKGSYSSASFPTNKKGSYSSNPKIKLKENEGNFKSAREKKAGSEAAVSVAATKGMQNSSSQRDSPDRGKDDSVLNATGLVDKPVPVVKPVPDKKPADTAQKSAVKKTQKDSATDKKWYLDIYASPDWPMDHTSYPGSNYMNQQMKLSYTVGLRINRSFGNHFSVKTGIQFSQLNLALKADTFGLDAYKIHLKSFDLPLLAGYSFGTEKLMMTVTAGGIANLYSFKNDSVLSIFKTNTGFSLYLGFNAEKKINQKISVYLEPYYRYRLTSMTISGVEFDKFIDVVGLSFGARYYFLKPKKK